MVVVGVGTGKACAVGVGTGKACAVSLLVLSAIADRVMLCHLA